MPWETDGSSKRRLELPHNWYTEIVPTVKRRDGNVCQWPRPSRAGGICGQPGRDVDHKTDRNSHRLEDLWLLCRWHHRKKTEAESAEARRAILDKTRHPVEKNPGLR